MHPARQIRLGAWTLSLLLFVASGVPAQAPPRPRRPAPAPKHEKNKAPELSVHPEWTHDLPAAPAGTPAYDAARAYLPIASGEVAAVSLQDGKVAWSVVLLPAGPLAAGEDLVFVPVAGAIEARDAATGTSRWRTALDGRLSAPLVWQNGWLLAASDRAGVVMLRAATGERLWQRSLSAPVRARAALTGDRIYVGLDDGQVMALALGTGEPIWARRLGGRPTTLAPLDDRVFAGADDKFLYCLSAKDGKQDWRWRTGGPIVGTPVFDKDNLYFLSLDNVLRALDRGNGHQVWQAGMAFRPAAGPFLVGRLLLVSGLIEVRAFRVADGSEAGGAEAGGVIAAAPHFLPPDEESAQPFILFTRDGQVIRMAPSAPVLGSKPFPAKMVYPLWPGEAGPDGTAR